MTKKQRHKIYQTRTSYRTYILLFSLIFLFDNLRAQDTVATSTATAKPKPFAFITQRCPATFVTMEKTRSRKKNIPTILWLTAATGFLIVADQHIGDQAHH